VQSLQEEHDDLANYENYIRSQYSALANDVMSPRATSPSAKTSSPTASSNNKTSVGSPVIASPRASINRRGSLLLNQQQKRHQKVHKKQK